MGSEGWCVLIENVSAKLADFPDFRSAAAQENCPGPPAAPGVRVGPGCLCVCTCVRVCAGGDVRRRRRAHVRACAVGNKLRPSSGHVDVVVALLLQILRA